MLHHKRAHKFLLGSGILCLLLAYFQASHERFNGGAAYDGSFGIQCRRVIFGAEDTLLRIRYFRRGWAQSTKESGYSVDDYLAERQLGHLGPGDAYLLA